MLGIDELIVFEIEVTAHWRRLKYEEFPEDPRNIEAAAMLDRMALELRALGGSELHQRLAQAAEELTANGDGYFSTVLSGMTRAIGFRLFPSSGENFLVKFLSYIEGDLLRRQRANALVEAGAVGAATRARDELILDAIGRQQLIARLDDIQDLLRKLQKIVPIDRPSAVGIGHNQPPDVISEAELNDYETDLAEGMVAIDVLRVELDSQQPRKSVVHLCILVISRVGNGLARLLGWIKKHLDLFTEAFAKSAGTASGKVAVASIATLTAVEVIAHLEGLHHKISELVSFVWKLF